MMLCFLASLAGNTGTKRVLEAIHICFLVSIDRVLQSGLWVLKNYPLLMFISVFVGHVFMEGTFTLALPAQSGPWLLIQFSDQLGSRPLPRRKRTQTQNKRIYTPNVHALSGIRTHDPSIRASEDSSCLRPRGHYDRLWKELEE
jgi:hypothetical protein